MKTRTVALLCCGWMMVGCDLPTTADEARERLGRDQEERIVPIQLPLPELSVTLAERLGALTDIVDTTDLSFSVDPDTFAFSLDSLLTLDPVDPDPVVQGYDIVVSDFTQDIVIALPAVPIALPGAVDTFPLAPSPSGGSVALPVDLSATFDSATFAAGSALQVALATDAVSSIDDVSAALESGGAQLATSAGSVTLSMSGADTLTIDLGGVTLPSTFDLVLSFTASTGDLGDNLIVDMAFVNATVASAKGVAAGSVTQVSFADTVTLDQTGADFTSATLAAGSVSVQSYDIGTLELTPTFDGDLTGLQVGGSTPGELVVAGDVAPPSGASTVDVPSTASITIAFTGLEVSSVTLNSVSMDVDQTVTIAGTDSTLSDLSQVTIASGTLELAVSNRLGVGGDITLSLPGAVDANGNVITTTFTLAPSPDGSPTVTNASVDLAGAVLTPDSLEPRVQGTISGTDVTVTPEQAADAVTVDPLLSFQPQQVVLSGVPDLRVRVNEEVSLSTSDLELGDLADLLGGIDFNDVTFSIRFENATGLAMRIDSFRMALLDSAGNAVIAGTDTARIELSNDTSGAILLPADTVTALEEAATVFVNALLDEIAAGRDVRVAAAGVGSPDADSGSVSLGDSIRVVYEISLGPDLTIDPGGITFDFTSAQALDLDSIAGELLADLSEDLVSAAVEFEAVNGMPLGMSVTMALAPTPADTTDFDPFAVSPNILLPAFQVAPAEVDSIGRVTAPVTSTPTASVDPAQFSILAQGQLGMAIQAEILGPAGDRAQLQPTDSLVMRPLLMLEIRVGGSTGGGQ